MKIMYQKFASLFLLLSFALALTQCGASESNVECAEFPLDGWENFHRPAFKGFMHAYQPCVVEVPDSEFPYRMWFFGWVTEIANPGQAGADCLRLKYYPFQIFHDASA